MHDCLRVTEILDQILTEILHDQPGIKGKNNVISVALTCREFLEIGLDVAWKTQSSLVPLIKTLPQSCWRDASLGTSSSAGHAFQDFDRHFTLRVEKLDIQEQKRFAFYANRIRRLQYLPYAWHAVSDNGCPYDMTIIRSIWATRMDKEQPLFPNLQYLEFAVINHAEPCLDIFLETQHVTLALYWNTSLIPSKSKPTQPTLFPIIEKYALNMQALDLGDFQEIERSTLHDTALSELVCKMTDLRALSCGPRKLTTEALLQLATLPHLHKLRIPHSSEEILQGLGQQTSKILFPQLEELVIRETKLPLFVTLMKKIRPTPIRKLVIQLRRVPHSEDIRDAFKSLAEGSSRLGDVHIIEFKFISHTQTAQYGQPMRLDTYKLDTTILVDGRILEPLLSFTNLTVLELGIPCKFDLGDTQIKAMANAWPRLRRLNLGSFLGWHVPSSITYDGLLHLVLKCPHLNYLSFSFDASSDIPLPVTISPRHVNKILSYLYVGDSAIGTNNPDSVGQFLASIFPKCTGIGGEWMVQNTHGHTISKNWAQWGKVVKALKKYQSAG